MTLTFFVPGVPAPQGSKRFLAAGVGIEANPRTKPWRKTVAIYALKAVQEAKERGEWFTLMSDQVKLSVMFALPRPQSHLTTSGERRVGAPIRPIGKPDLDKLLRAVCDALNGVVWRDDAIVWEVSCCKVYARQGVGAHIAIHQACHRTSEASPSLGFGFRAGDWDLTTERP